MNYLPTLKTSLVRQMRTDPRLYEPIVAAYDARHSLQTIASQYGVSRYAIRSVVEMHGRAVRSGAPRFTRSAAERAEAVQLAKTHGPSFAARKFRVHYTTVIHWRRLARRAEQRQIAATVPPAETVAQRAISPCEGCGNPSPARLCDWCALVA